MKSGGHKIENFSKKLKAIENKTAKDLEKHIEEDDEGQPMITEDLNLTFINNPLHSNRLQQLINEPAKLQELKELNQILESLSEEMRELNQMKVKLIKSNKHLDYKMKRMREDILFMKDFFEKQNSIGRKRTSFTSLGREDTMPRSDWIAK